MVRQASLGVEKTTTGTAPARFVALGGWDIKIETKQGSVPQFLIFDMVQADCLVGSQVADWIFG